MSENIASEDSRIEELANFIFQAEIELEFHLEQVELWSGHLEELKKEYGKKA